MTAKLVNIIDNQNTENIFHIRIIFLYLIFVDYHSNFALRKSNKYSYER